MIEPPGTTTRPESTDDTKTSGGCPEQPLRGACTSRSCPAYVTTRVRPILLAWDAPQSDQFDSHLGLGLADHKVGIVGTRSPAGESCEAAR